MKRINVLCLFLIMTAFCINNWQTPFSSKTRANFEPVLPTTSKKPITRSIQLARGKGELFPVIELFQPQADSVFTMATAKLELPEVKAVQQAVNDGTILNLNHSQIQNILVNDLKAITFVLPSATAGTIELELLKVNIYSPDFTVITSSSDQPIENEKGVHYQGIVKGDPNTIAAISIFPNEIMGFYSTEESGNVVLGRLGGINPNDRHILYATRDLKAKKDIACDTKDDKTILPHSAIRPQAVSPASKRVRVYVEADFDLFQNRGSVAGTTSYIAGFFNQSAAIYSNESIPIVLSQVFVWTSPSPYTGTTSHAVLQQFQAVRDSFIGDFGHLVTLKRFGGVAAGYDGFCNSNIQNSQCVSGIFNFYENVPTYSWTVEVFTHEMGHLMGSRHTHACVWNGNGTAIDGCGPTANSNYSEGDCPTGPIPPEGGTIMSYCHLNAVGINFANGFGPQPGNVIRSQFNNAGCLATGIGINDVTIIEGHSGTKNMVFTVSLSAMSVQMVSVNFATSNNTATAGSDYIAASGTISFAPGVTNQQVTVVINGDTTVEPNETFYVNLTNATNATITDSRGTGTITNDENALPTISINDVTVTEGNSGSGTTIIAFTVTLSAVSSQTVSVNFATANGTAISGSDYEAYNGSLAFIPNSTTQTIALLVHGDTTAEPNETFYVNLTNATNATISDSQGRGTIINDDGVLPTISINDVTVIEGNSGTKNMVFTVTLSAVSSQTVSVNFATASGTAISVSDYEANNGSLLFLSGVTTRTITLLVYGDTAVEPNEIFYVNLTNATNATISDSQGRGTITNDDGVTPTISINDVTVIEGNSGTKNMVFTVTLSAVSSQTVSVNFATANNTATAGSDYIAASGTISFAPGITNQQVSVVMNGDTTFEGYDTFYVNLTNATNATITDSQGIGTIINDD
jgi:disulfide oxidoreductase YuzD